LTPGKKKSLTKKKEERIEGSPAGGKNSPDSSRRESRGAPPGPGWKDVKAQGDERGESDDQLGPVRQNWRGGAANALLLGEGP